MMEELQIAEAMAARLHRLSNWDKYSSESATGEPCCTEEELSRHLQAKKAELAIHRAKSTGRDLGAVWAEVELGIMRHLARLLARTIDPAIASLGDSTVPEEGMVCGVCQEEMRRGERSREMGCRHRFHPLCIEMWVRSRNSCPLCRHRMEIRRVDFQL